MANSSSITREFELGIASSFDPANEQVIEHGGEALTTLTSPWLFKVCSVCKHTFRRNDVVYIEPDGSVYHNSPTLPCHKRGTYDATGSTTESAQFFAGLYEAFPTTLEAHVRRLAADDPLVAPPVKGFTRMKCKGCGHTLRPNDQVILCPCSPAHPICQTAIHRDPEHGLYCFDMWDSGKDVFYFCQVRSQVKARGNG